MNEAQILEPGETCWRVASCSRAAFLIDAARYFTVLEGALRRARHSVLILGWDIHSRTLLGERGSDSGGIALGQLLRGITDEAPDLEVDVLTWDFAPIYLTERELLPLVQLRLRAGSGVRMHLDSAHPIGASHHQKVVVIDDRVAFSGGIDLTVHRWDAPDHDPEDERRTLPDGTPYPPYHDVQVMVEGEVARALGEMARQRWRTSTGEELRPPPRDADPWPDGVEPDLRDVEIGIARTMPRYRDREEAREIESLYLRAIATAERSIYLENQYLTADAIGDALCRRLAEEVGPEALLVVPRSESGPLEQAVLGALRARMVQRLREADRYGRMRIVTPYVRDEDVYVHSKVIVVDDRFAQIGSANLCNRSMGLDTECDLAVEGRDEESRSAIESLRARLLGEHLGTPADQVQRRLADGESLLALVDAHSDEQRGLRELIVDPEAATQLLDARLADPDEPIVESYVRRNLPGPSVEAAERSLPNRIAAGALALVVLTAAVVWARLGTPDPGTVVEHLDVVRTHPAGPWIMLAAFVVASLAMLPVNVLIIATVALLGPWVGAAISWAGIALSAAIGWGLGHVAWRDAVRRIAGDRLNELSRRLSRHGVAAMIAVRVVPIAPFTVVSLVAGSSRVSLRDFITGTQIGTLPGVLLLAFASDRILAAVEAPSIGTVLVAALAVAVLGVTIWLLHRALRGSG